MIPRPRRARERLCRGVLGCLLGIFFSGCATTSIDSARSAFYRGADAPLETLPDPNLVPEKDRVLFLMERGTALQAAGRYEDSVQDFIDASDLIDKLETLSVSKGATSMVVNDTVQNYRGVPYERTLVHGLASLNHMALGRWNDAAVEARRIIRSLSPEVKSDYPEDAFSRYLAGFCLELTDDPSNAALQYRKASELLPDLRIDDRTGYLYPGTNLVNTADVPAAPRNGTELVCFVMLGRSPRGYETFDRSTSRPSSVHAEFYAGDRYLGRSYNLADTHQLARETEAKLAARKAAKTAGRIVVKEAIADSLESETDEEWVGFLARMILIGLLERPDVRRWETLPRYLQVARFPCPDDLEGYRVVIKDNAGQTFRSLQVNQPIQRHRDTWVSFFRDIRARDTAPRSHAPPPQFRYEWNNWPAHFNLSR
jgi:hypothetical protein